MSGQMELKVKDPVQRSLVEKQLMLRNACSVKLANLPKGYTYSDLLGLAPDLLACRIIYDPVSRKPRKYAYLEFVSSDTALKCANRLNNAEFQRKKLTASVGGDLPERVDAYILNSVRLWNIHRKTTKGEIAKYFPTSVSIDIPVKVKGRLAGGGRSGIANLTFGTVEEAIAAVQDKQGCIIRGRRISVHFCTRKVKSKIVGLSVFGLKRSTTEDEIRALFPQANGIDMYPLGGFAVLRYDLVEDCKLDRKNALGVKLKNRKLRIAFKFQNDQQDPNSHTPGTEREAHTSLIFVKNLGRSATREQVSELFPEAKVISMPRKGKASRGFALLDCRSVLLAKRILAKSYVLNNRTLILQPASDNRPKPDYPAV